MATSTSLPQGFINSLEPHEVKQFQTAIYLSGGYVNLVNRRHISSTLDLQQLATMKSTRPQDGAFLTEWMECKLQQHHLQQPPIGHCRITLYLNGNAWPEPIHKRFNTFCASNSIDRLNIFVHHLILRRSLGEKHLPQLGAQLNDKQGSHLCDTLGCVQENHLCIETKKNNLSRCYCRGIELTIYQNTAGEFLILQVDPCEHGKAHAEANGDFFKYSCRKIKASFVDDEDLANLF